MTARRDLLIGAACAMAAGGAWAFAPRDHVTLLGDERLDDLIPRTIGPWREIPPDALVVPVSDDSLAARLYNQVVGRVYTDADDNSVMVLIAYGRTQNDALQLHRPEACYPALGYQIVRSSTMMLPTGAAAPPIPARVLTAANSDRTDQILYWTRIGESFPDNGREQRLVKLRLQLRGIIPDGVLVRFSNISRDRDAGLALNARFARAFLAACPASARIALAGTTIGQAL